MKESQLFIHFFKINLIFLSVFVVGGGIIGGAVQASRPTIYTVDRLFEVRSKSPVVPEQTLAGSLIVADHLVSLLRTKNVQQQIAIPLGADVNSVRFSAVGFKLSVSSHTLPESTQTLAKTSEYMLSRFNQDYPGSDYFLAAVGNFEESTTQPNISVGISVASFLGFAVGLISALIKIYLRSF